MSTDLHTQIRTEVERRLAIARAATPGPWGRYGNLGYAVFSEGVYDDPDYEPPDVTHGSGCEADAEHIALHDPDDAIRRYEHALATLESHHPVARDGSPAWTSLDGTAWCWSCSGMEHDRANVLVPSPCDDVLRLATSLGIDTGGQP